MRPVFLCSRSSCLSCFLSLKFRGEPGGRVSELDSFSFQGGQFVEGGRHYSVLF